MGRIVKEKGVHLYVDAIKNIYSELNEWSFKIIGSVKLGNNIHYNNYSKQVIENFDSLGERTEFKGYLSQSKLSKILKDASIIVIPSLWKEPFGLVAAEAMANGIAVICSKRGGLKEIVNKNGIMIDNIDSKKIVSSILKLTKNKDELLKYQNLSWKNHKFTSKTSSIKLDKLKNNIINK